MRDNVERMFPGDGREIPTDAERDRADELAGFAIPRQRLGAMPYFADPATNRAFLRSQVRRALYRQFNARCDAQEAS
ncbi:hypothetical protein SEA_PHRAPPUCCINO_18 [Mycobacterium phage Phrappuccino]|uniref:Uncharacterized protein n=1 Tax=Mycobacterium phage Phrappuccino TaxID=2591223 RepID=A0A514DDL2_9CAUD|nr:hypothetical protein KHQ87_gp018 [Mycobacterium phage Phrappuccino]QDH91696.1 hypothetical protein SEA_PHRAPPUCCINO_18 [Mycobacterium phage Phrappuccino]QIQ63140.1 hypothetical protein SEA_SETTECANDELA_18 [Mycobacterium phage Settecandela]